MGVIDSPSDSLQRNAVMGFVVCSLRLSSSSHYSSESWVKGTLLASELHIPSNGCDEIHPPRGAILTANLVNLVVFVLLASFVSSVVRRDGPIRFALVSLPFME